jgi:hypothetical protein
MKNNPLRFFVLPPLLLILLWVYWPQGQDERALRATVEEFLAYANRGEHLALKKHLSPGCETAIAGYSLSPEQALISVQRFDREDRAQYRLRAVTQFRPGQDAVVEVERQSGINSVTRSFFLPLRYEHRRWRVAGEFPDGAHSWEELLDLFN